MIQCAAPAESRPPYRQPRNLDPDPHGIRDNWEEVWRSAHAPPTYNYSPASTCDGCWGWLYDDFTGVIFLASYVQLVNGVRDIPADMARPYDVMNQHYAFRVNPDAIYPGKQMPFVPLAPRSVVPAAPRRKAIRLVLRLVSAADCEHVLRYQQPSAVAPAGKLVQVGVESEARPFRLRWNDGWATL